MCPVSSSPGILIKELDMPEGKFFIKRRSGLKSDPPKSGGDISMRELNPFPSPTGEIPTNFGGTFLEKLDVGLFPEAQEPSFLGFTGGLVGQ